MPKQGFLPGRFKVKSWVSARTSDWLLGETEGRIATNRPTIIDGELVLGKALDDTALDKPAITMGRFGIDFESRNRATRFRTG